jgi:hypothetical protein
LGPECRRQLIAHMHRSPAYLTGYGQVRRRARQERAGSRVLSACCRWRRLLLAEDDPSSLSPNAAIQAGEHHYKMRPHSEARRTAIRRFATPSLMFMRWKRELIELLLT